MDRIRRVGGGDDVVHGQQELHALFLGAGHHVLGVLDVLAIQQGSAHAAAHGREEGVGHAAADDDLVALFDQVVDDADLVGNLRAAQDGDQRTDGVFKGVAHEADLFLDQVAHGGGKIVGHAGGGAMGSVGGTESVVHEDLGQRRELFGKLGVVLGLARLKADVFQQHGFAVLQFGGKGLRAFAYHVLGQLDLFAQQLGKARGNGGHGELGIERALRAAQMGAEDQTRALIQQVLDGGQGSDDALVAGDDAVFHLHVEIAAYQYALAGYGNVFNGFFVQ